MRQYLLQIQDVHVLRSALSLLANPANDVEEGHRWAVTIEGHTFATKSLIRRAYCYAVGISFNNIPDKFYTDSFTTKQARDRLEELGFYSPQNIAYVPSTGKCVYPTAASG